jgi:diadenosine tetraphosphatase ApaH/serine/threonine PP2A family protein phosphatase
VISDIHANLQAFEAVMAASASIPYEGLLVLGDLVGYGADPNAVVERVRTLQPHALIRGNHDKVGSGLESAEGFNAVARAAIRWTYDALTSENRAWLAALPAGPVLVDDVVEICHGSPFDEDTYLFDDVDAIRGLHAARRPLCLYGHTHVQVGFSLERDRFAVLTDNSVRPLSVNLSAGGGYLFNPGSVGQPRDGDPRAAFAVVDTDMRDIAIHRVPYAVEQAQARILAEGLPEVLAHRLGLGR